MIKCAVKQVARFPTVVWQGLSKKGKHREKDGPYKKEKKRPLKSISGIVHPKLTFHHFATHPCFRLESGCIYSPMQLLFAHTNGKNSNDWIYMETKDCSMNHVSEESKKLVCPVWTATWSQQHRVLSTIITIWPLTYMFKKQVTQPFYTFSYTLCILHRSTWASSVAAGWNSVHAWNLRPFTAKRQPENCPAIVQVWIDGVLSKIRADDAF